jgi:hypothetical protein
VLGGQPGGTYHVVTAEGVEVDESVALDGFLNHGRRANAEVARSTSAAAGMVVTDGAGAPRLRNLFFRLIGPCKECGGVWGEHFRAALRELASSISNRADGSPHGRGPEPRAPRTRA